MMSPAKKKATHKKPAARPPVPPPPVVPPESRRFWKVVQTKNLIGGTMFLLGAGFCVGFWISDRANGVEKFVLGVGVVLMIFGAHFMSSAPTEAALKSLGSTAKDILPFARKSDSSAGGQ